MQLIAVLAIQAISLIAMGCMLEYRISTRFGKRNRRRGSKLPKRFFDERKV